MGMRKPSSKQSPNSLSVPVRLRRKLHPYRHPEMSGLMRAIVGFVIDAPFGNPRIADMTITPDGLILARAEGEVSPLAVGRYPDLPALMVCPVERGKAHCQRADGGRASIRRQDRVLRQGYRVKERDNGK
jgi:uncharacterized protein (DUF433 family)